MLIFEVSMNVHVLVNLEGAGRGHSVLSIVSFNPDLTKRRKRSWLAVRVSPVSVTCLWQLDA